MSDELIIATSPEMRMPSTALTLTPIIPFDLIVDTDFGLIELIRLAYRDEEVFDLVTLDAGWKEIIAALVNRTDPNPLSIIMKNKDDKELLDIYYNNFIESEYEQILEHSIYTGIEGAVELFITSECIKPTILCKNELEERYIKKIDGLKNVSVVVGDWKSIKIDLYDPVYFKDIKDAFNLILEGKNIYVANYGFNFDIDEYGIKEIKDIFSELFMDNNQAAIIDVYNIDETYYAVG